MSQGPQRAFNLIEEPWIPVQLPDGTVESVGIRSALIHARRYVRLAEVIPPPSVIGIYRLLLAVLHRSLTLHVGSWDENQRAQWFVQGVPASAVHDYLTRWGDRFWLIDPQYPFLQVPALRNSPETRDRFKPWTQICLDRASGDTATLFDHSLDEHPPDVSYAEACRYLVGFLQFTPGGLVRVLKTSDFGGPLANCAAVIALGRTLGETLVLNLHPSTKRNPNADRPSWEKDPPSIRDLTSAPRPATGPNDRYSRLSRAVLVAPDTSRAGYVRKIWFGPGLALEEDPHAPDPMVAYRVTRGRPRPIGFERGRALWRELPSLLPAPGTNQVHPPGVLTWARSVLLRVGLQREELPILAGGVSSKQAKLLRWRLELLRLPARILLTPEAAEHARKNVELSERVFEEIVLGELFALARELVRPGQQGRGADLVRQMVSQGPAAAVFFHEVELKFPAMLQSLAAQDYEGARVRWHAVLRTAAWRAWSAEVERFGGSVPVLRAEARTSLRLRQRLKKMLPDSS